ncbi:MAG: UTRA domain-containing protein [Parvularculaceae bacterium]|nr:UTRA domain-containing protein [Parvularculaceae bacterium]
MNERSHLFISTDIRTRITTGEWSPGALMPREIELADEYGCARATINRALQTLADEGLIERKRRAGTRILELPKQHARLEIPIIRHEVEAMGQRYHPNLLLNEERHAPDVIAANLKLRTEQRVLHLQTLHMADDQPFAFEDRWLNIDAVPEVRVAPLDKVSANEWLIRHIPYASGNVSFGAIQADEHVAGLLEAKPGSALFSVERTTWRGEQMITTVQIAYPPGYQLRSAL